MGRDVGLEFVCFRGAYRLGIVRQVRAVRVLDVFLLRGVSLLARVFVTLFVHVPLACPEQRPRPPARCACCIQWFVGYEREAVEP